MVWLSYTGLALLLDVSVKSLLLAVLAGAGLLVLRVRNTNVRHRVWTGALLGMLVLPLAVPVTPGLPLPAWLVPVLPARGMGEAGSSPTSDPARPSSRLDKPPVAGVGVDRALGESSREVGHGTFGGSTSTEPPLDDDRLHDAREGALGRAAVARAGLEVGPRFGFWPVAIFAAYVGGLAVIATTGDRPQYAHHLLEVAGALSGGRGRLIQAAVIPMARRGSVETRIAAILDGKRPLAGRVGRLGTAALIAVIAPTVLFAAALRPSSQAPPNAAEETSQASAKPGDARDELPPSPLEAPTTPDAAPDVKVIRGTVVDKSGNPVAGADVWYPAKWIPGRDRRLTLHAKSDQEGRFELGCPAAWLAEARPTVLFWSIWAHHPGHCIGTCSAYEALHAEQEAPEVEIALGPETDASFVVAAPDGEPVAGAVVEPFQYEAVGYDLFPPELAPLLRATTDADGRAALPAVARDRLTGVRVTSKEFGAQHLDIYGARTVPAKFTIPLRPVGRIEGHVIAKEPKMAHGVTIHLTTEQYDDQLKDGQMEGRATVVTDEEGRFSVPAMAAGRLKGLARWDKSLPFRPRVPEGLEVTAGQTKQVDVRVLPAVLARGTVRTQDTKEPVAGVEISIRYGTYVQGDNVTSDEEGKFSTYVLPGHVRMHAIYIPGELVQFPGSQMDRYEVPADADQFDLPPLELLRCKTVTGRLIDRDGRPIAGAGVTAVRVVPFSRWVCGHGQTDDDGRFTMTQFPRNMTLEEVRWQVHLSDESRLEVYVVQRDPWVLQPPTSETGTVLEGRAVDQHGLPVPDARVMPTWKVDTESRPVYGTPVLTMTTDAQGRFQTPEPLKRGRSYGLEVSLDDKLQRALGRSPWIEATGKTISFGDVAVERRWCLRGTVRNEAGRPVAGAKVTHRFDADTITTHVTDANGRFVVPGLFAVGRFFFLVTAPGYDDFDGSARLERESDREDGGVDLVLRRKAPSPEP